MKTTNDPRTELISRLKKLTPTTVDLSDPIQQQIEEFRKGDRTRSLSAQSRLLNHTNIDNVIKKLIANLDDPDFNVKYMCIETLKNFQERAQSATPKLITLLDDTRLRYETLSALSAIGGDLKDAIPKLIPLLDGNSSDLHLALNVCRRVKWDAKEASEIISNSINPGKYDLDLKNKLITLKEIGFANETIVSKLIGIIKQGGDYPREAVEALCTLGKEHADKAVKVIIESCASHPTDSFKLIGEILKEPAIPELIKILKNGKPEEKKLAAICLGDIALQPEKCIPTLVEALKANTKNVKTAPGTFNDDDIANHCVRALGSFRDAAKPAIPTLIEILNDQNLENTQLKRDIISIFNHIKSSELIPALRKCLEIPTLRTLAIHALENCGNEGKEAIQEIFKVIDSDNNYSAIRAIVKIISQDDKNNISFLCEKIKSGNEAEKHLALEIIREANLRTAETYEAILQALDDPTIIEHAKKVGFIITRDS